MLKYLFVVIGLVVSSMLAFRLHPGTAKTVLFASNTTDSTVTNVDSIVVEKALRKMTVFLNGEPLKEYKIALGKNPIGHKQYQGDMRTPEGLYTIYDKNPNSSCHKNLGISYPNDADRAAAKQLGKSPGGDIKIHGILNGYGYIGKAHVLSDWTWGCIAVTDEEMDELYNAVPIGTPILILP